MAIQSKNVWSASLLLTTVLLSLCAMVASSGDPSRATTVRMEPLSGTAPTVSQPVRLFKAEGRHQCQSLTDAGHSCNVLGTNYTDCSQAHAKLKMEDCCHSTRRCKKDSETGEETCRFGGSSIDFKLLSCSAYK
jgi:hypothetical protein